MTKKKSVKVPGAVQPSEDDVRFCDKCRKNVNIGTGGDGNWKIHLKSKAHREAIVTAQTGRLTTFFKKTFASSHPAPAPDHLRGPSHLTHVGAASSSRTEAVSSSRTEAASSSRTETASSSRTKRAPSSDMTTASTKRAESVDIIPARQVVTTAAVIVSDEIRRLRALISTLPPQPTDNISASTAYDFPACPSYADDGEYESPWQFVDSYLNNALGYGLSAAELAERIRQGNLVLVTFCDWLQTVVRWPGVTMLLLEGKLARLTEALGLCGAREPCARAAPAPQPVIDLTADTEDTCSTRLEDVRTGLCAPTDQDAHTGDIGSSAGRPPQTLSQPPLPAASSPYHPQPSSSVGSACPGYDLDIPAGRSPYSIYPFGLHAERMLPWNISIHQSGMTLRSNDCIGTGAYMQNKLRPCRNCSGLRSNTTLTGIVDRMDNGIHENTPHAYLPFSSLGELLKRKNTQIDRLRFDSLNRARSHLVRGRTINGYKRFLYAVSASDPHSRVHKVVAIARGNGMGIHAIVARLDSANARVYASRSYEEIDFQRSYLLWKLGGQRAADIASRSLGLPSLSATRRKFTSGPVLASAGFPTVLEMLRNLQTILPLNDDDSPMAYVIEVDELKLEKRFRWEPCSNMILGVCREHGHQCSLEFRSLDELRVLSDLLSSQQVHAATEATVIAVSCLSDNHNEYAALPFVISGTCKQEDANAHAVLLERAVEALRTHFGLGSRRKVYCIASDGESRRGKALGALTMSRELGVSSPIYPLLRPLSLFNRLVGANDLTCDKDWRHVLKRFRNALLRSAPLRINGSSLSRPLIKVHLMDGLKMKSYTADSLLSPNDPQDVTLAFKLLNSISSLSLAEPTSSTPIYQRTRRSLSLLGRVYMRLLKCYTDTSSSLRDQLEQLGAVSHLLLVLYMHDKGGFIPAILYLDAQIMIKNAYVCTAKMIVDRPTGRIWIIMLGTDGLEKVFGIVRTMIGSDSNVDQLQLANRVTGATQCSRILQEHPEWDRGPRRLAVPSLQGRADDVSTAADHVNPASWTGDVSVQDIVLQTCWYRGRRLAESDLQEFDIPYEHILCPSASTRDVDVLRPFGDGRVVYLSGLRPEEAVEEEVETPVTSASESDRSRPLDHASDEIRLQPELEDFLGEEDVRSRAEAEARKVEAWLSIDDSPGAAKQHKASFLRLLSESPASFTPQAPESTNRLGRICGFTRYPNSAVIVDSLDDCGAPTLGFDDPALTLLHVHGLLFLAVVQISDIRQNGQSRCAIPIADLCLSSVRIRFEVLSLQRITPSPDNSHADWQWSGRVEKFRSSGSCEVEGRGIQPYDPQLVCEAARRQHMSAGMSTYQFKTAELCALACELFSNGRSSGVAWPKVSPTNGFPYRIESGDLCFLCETEGASQEGFGREHHYVCPFCPTLLLSAANRGVLLNHIGAHILFDSRIDRSSTPCGFCLSTADTCAVYLKRGQGARRGERLDYNKSRCPAKYTLSITRTSQPAARSPCTNVPMRCSLCPKDAPAVWKYNLSSHLLRAHRQDPEVEPFASLWRLSPTEVARMEKLYSAKPRISKRKRGATSKAAKILEKISEGHVCKMALRTTHLDDSGVITTAAGDMDECMSVDPVPVESPDSSHSSDSDSDSTDSSSSDTESDEDMSSCRPRAAAREPVASISSAESTVQGTTQAATESDIPTVSEERLTPGDIDGPALHETLVPVPGPGTTGLLSAGGGGGSTVSSLSFRIRLPARPARTSTFLQGGSEAVPQEEFHPCICEEESESAMIRCDGPGCGQWYHFDCINLHAQPEGDWFCDDDCRVNAGLPVRKAKRQRLKK